MEVIFLKLLCRIRIKGFHKGDRDLGRLFHYIPKLSGDNHLSASFGKRSLNEQNLSSCTGPCKTGYHARCWVFQNFFVMDSVISKELWNPLLADCNALLLTFYQLHGSVAAEHIHLLFQPTYTCLCCIFLNDPTDCVIAHLQILGFDSHALHCLGQKMASGNLEFLHCSVARELDHFHSVQKRLRNRICSVGCAYK